MNAYLYGYTEYLVCFDLALKIYRCFNLFYCSCVEFLDLAGSERANKTGATGNTLKEGIGINSSLTALG